MHFDNLLFICSVVKIRLDWDTQHINPHPKTAPTFWVGSFLKTAVCDAIQQYTQYIPHLIIIIKKTKANTSNRNKTESTHRAHTSTHAAKSFSPSEIIWLMETFLICIQSGTHSICEPWWKTTPKTFPPKIPQTSTKIHWSFGEVLITTWQWKYRPRQRANETTAFWFGNATYVGKLLCWKINWTVVLYRYFPLHPCCPLNVHSKHTTIHQMSY